MIITPKIINKSNAINLESLEIVWQRYSHVIWGIVEVVNLKTVWFLDADSDTYDLFSIPNYKYFDTNFKQTIGPSCRLCSSYLNKYQK